MKEAARTVGSPGSARGGYSFQGTTRTTRKKKTAATKSKMKTNITTNNGKRMNLTTDDTLTLAFPRMEESTPATLRAIVCEKSLRRIAATSADSNEISKVEKALALKLQLSSHGT